MHTEARYNNLQTDNFVAQKIIADEIILKDTVIKSDVMMAGSTIKKLYESQPNTNPFDNDMKTKLLELDNLIKCFKDSICLPRTQVAVPMLSDIHESDIKNNHAILCRDEDNMIYVCKINDVVKYFQLAAYEPYVNVTLNVSGDESAQVKLTVT